MVEAGADEVPEETLLRGVRAGPPGRSIKLCEAQEELRSSAGKPKWLDPEITDELRARARRPHLASDIAGPRPASEAAAVVEELEAELMPGADDGAPTEEDIVRGARRFARASRSCSTRQRLAAVDGARPRAVRGRPDARSPRPSRTPSSSSRRSGTCSSTGSSRRSSCRSPSGRPRSRASRRSSKTGSRASL